MPKKNTYFLVIFSFIFLISCKKGEDDPAVSFLSRKARVAGEWRMTSGKASYTENATYSYNESYTFDGSNVKMVVTGGIYTGKYSLQLNMEKDGSFSVSEDLAGSKFTANGVWNFSAGVGEEKKKESLIFEVNEVEQGFTYSANLFQRQSSHFIYKIKELRNDKLVIYSSGKIYSNASGQYATLSTEYILEPIK